MALKAIVNSLDALPEATKALYRREGDFFVLDVEAVGDWRLEDVGGLKGALGKERSALATAERQLAAFRGLDPVKAKEAIEQVEKWAGMDPEKKAGEIVAARENALKAKHAEESAKTKGQLEKLTTQLRRTLVVAAAERAIAAAKGNSTLLLPHVASRIDMRQNPTTEEFEVVVLDKAGNPAIGDGMGRPMTIEQLVESFKAEEAYAVAFSSNGASGSGKTGSSSTGSGGSGNPKVVSLSDRRAVGANLEKIASGEVQVTA